MTFKENSCLPSPSEECVQDFEEMVEVRLPAEFIHLLEVGNGGTPEENLFDDGRGDRVLERLLCLLEEPSADEVNGWYDIAVVLSQIGEFIVDDENATGNSIIPFGVLFGGDLVCMDFRTDATKPKIVVWYHEESEEFKPIVKQVADSLTDFLGMLQPMRD